MEYERKEGVDSLSFLGKNKKEFLLLFFQVLFLKKWIINFSTREFGK